MSYRRDNKILTRGILSGALSLTLSTLIVKALGLIYKLPISNILGDEGMGFFNSAYAVYSFFYLLCTAGVPKGVMILISKAKAEGKEVEEGRILNVIFKLYLIIGVIISLLLIIFAPSFASFIGNKRSDLTLLVIAPSIVFVSVGGVLRGYLSANQDLLNVAVSQLLEGVGKLVFGLIFAYIAKALGLDLPIISAFAVLGITVGSILGFVFLFIILKNKTSIFKTGQIEHNDMHIIKRLLKVSIPITVSAAIMSLTNIIDLVLLMRKLISVGFDEAYASSVYGNYTTLAVPMFNLAISLVTPISISYLPVITKAFVKKDNYLFKQSVSHAIEFTSFLSAPIMAGLYFYSYEILDVLFKNADVQTGSNLLRLLCPAIFFSSMLTVINTALEGCGIVKAPAISMLFGSVIKIILTVFCFRDGNGAIISSPLTTVVSYSLSLIISLIIMSVKCKNDFYILKGAFLPHLSAFISVFISRLLYDFAYKGGGELILLIISAFIAILLYVFLSVVFGVINKKKLEEVSFYTKVA